MESLESRLGRTLIPPKGGRPKQRQLIVFCPRIKTKTLSSKLGGLPWENESKIM